MSLPDTVHRGDAPRYQHYGAMDLRCDLECDSSLFSRENRVTRLNVKGVPCGADLGADMVVDSSRIAATKRDCGITSRRRARKDG